MEEWREFKDLMDRLIVAQQHSAYRKKDIITAVSFIDSRETLEEYVKKIESKIYRK